MRGNVPESDDPPGYERDVGDDRVDARKDVSSVGMLEGSARVRVEGDRSVERLVSCLFVDVEVVVELHAMTARRSNAVVFSDTIRVVGIEDPVVVA